MPGPITPQARGVRLAGTVLGATAACALLTGAACGRSAAPGVDTDVESCARVSVSVTGGGAVDIEVDVRTDVWIDVDMDAVTAAVHHPGQPSLPAHPGQPHPGHPVLHPTHPAHPAHPTHPAHPPHPTHPAHP
ncbi:hypothetical protein, partial [Streptomyces sp. NRRL B-24484]|uniref:hypothetical protein n=1 Tax=Streptomyces sp. NRRL B-24484 TaxID=1463833 RepID=UPI0004BEC7B4